MSEEVRGLTELLLQKKEGQQTGPLTNRAFFDYFAIIEPVILLIAVLACYSARLSP